MAKKIMDRRNKRNPDLCQIVYVRIPFHQRLPGTVDQLITLGTELTIDQIAHQKPHETMSRGRKDNQANA